MKRTILRSLTWGALVAVLATVTVTAFQSLKPGPQTLEVLGTVPPFELVERSGETVTLDDLRGDIWIADFIFTRCGGTCPVMTSRMAELHGDLDGRGVQFVSMSVDPEYDSPDVLAAYAERYGVAGRDDWRFLTGDKRTVYELIQRGFRLGVQDRSAEYEEALKAVEEGEPWEGGEPFIHSTRFVLVDRDAAIRGYYDGTDAAALQRLRRDIARLLAEAPDDPA